MTWYLLNIFILTVSWLLLNSRKVTVKISKQHKLEKKSIFCIIATLNWIILSGLRHISIGADTYSYKIMFENVKNMSWSRIFSQFYDRYIGGVSIKDPGYSVIEKLFQEFSSDYQLWLLFIAVVFFVMLGIFIYHKSENPYISYILFSCLFYSFFAITGHRQTIATVVVVLFGINYIQQRKLFLFIVLVLIGTTIHASAICFLPFYWLSEIKITKVSLMVYWILIILAFIFRNNLFNVLKLITGYENYNQFEGAGAGIFLYLLISLALITTFFRNELLSINSSNMQICINALMISCIFSSLLLINQSTMRVIQYYSLFLMILLPNLCLLVKNKRQKLLFNIIMVSVLCLLLIKNQPYFMFFWQ